MEEGGEVVKKKPESRLHLYPLIRKWTEEGWSAENIADELRARGENINWRDICTIRRRIIYYPPGFAYHYFKVRSTSNVLKTFFKRLKFKWQREGKIGVSTEKREELTEALPAYMWKVRQ